MNYKDQAQIERMVQNSNVVINLLGPRHKIKRREDFEFINIEVPERIAKACAKHGIHRLIHFSAAGAEAKSPSLDFQTKHEAEDIVRKAFPNVTIFRPCPVFGLNDNLASIIRGQINFFWNKFVPVYDDCTTKKQPIRDNDVAKCVLNALKLEESKGKTYELGGPHALTKL
jgi:NADH dehydrogenase (ubiquinone) 1 alpha subcomplex subunit 9